jgi:hypothetical protein
MEFINIIASFLQRARDELSSNVERNIFGSPQKWAKVHPINNLIDFNKQHDIETGLYHGEDMCRIIIHYSSTEECKWDAGQIL